MFDHPIKQYALFANLQQQVTTGELVDIPEALRSNRDARPYYGIFKLVLPENKLADITAGNAGLLVEEALHIEQVVDRAVAENSLNPHNIEAAIKARLLARLFKLVDMDYAEALLEQIIHITRHSRTKAK